MRRMILAVALFAVVGVASVAATWAAPAASVVTSSVAATCGSTPSTGGTLVVGHNYEVDNLNPLSPSNNGEILVQAEIYQGLTRPAPSGAAHIVPGLADRWKEAKNRLSWTLHIREKAKFSNGQPVTAADVKFSLDQFINPKKNVIFPSLVTDFRSVAVVNAHTIRVNLKKPVSPFLHYISMFPAFIVPKALVQKNPTAFYKNPISAGPFRIKEFVRGSHITLERNPYYWERNLPHLDQVRLDFVVDDNTRLLKLRAGEIGVAEGVPFNQINILRKVSGVRVQSNASTRQDVIWLNHTHKPFEDLKVRQALNLAIDRTAISQAVYAGTGEIPNNELPKLQYNDNSQAKYKYDLAKAKELMAQSSVPNGFTSSFLIPAGASFDKQLALLLQQEWKAIGVNINIEEVDQATLRDRHRKYDYDMLIPQPLWFSDLLVPDEFAFVFADTTSNGIDGYFSGYKNEAIWKLVQAAGAAPDPQRGKLWSQVQRAWNQQVPWISLMWLPTETGIRDSVCNVKVNALGWYLFEQAWARK